MAYEKVQTKAQRQKFFAERKITYDQLKSWKKRREAIFKNASKRSTRNFRTSEEARAQKKLGFFDKEERALFKEFKFRRQQGLAVDGEFFKAKIKLLVKEGDYDTEKKAKFKGSDKWLHGFKKRFGISMQEKTNRKSTSVEERLPKVQNFHWWAIYQMALEKP